MPDYAFTGSKGSGKSLVAVGRIQEYLRAGKRVATNLNLYLDKLLPPDSIAHAIRLQDFPDIEDLKLIGRGHYVPDPRRPGEYSKHEKHNGLLVLDECAVFFNSRTWGDKGRAAVIAWLRHSRKLGWDVIYIMQDLDSVDKQIRKGLMEHHGVCKRADRMRIPLIGGLLKSMGLGFLSHPPRVHIATIKYGLDQHALVVDRYYYRGALIEQGYDTNQVFTEFDLNSDSVGIHSVLSPWHTKGRYLPPSFFKQFCMWLNGTPYRAPITTHKLPLVRTVMEIQDEKQRIELFKRLDSQGAFNHPLARHVARLPDPKKRIEFLKRFEECGAFTRSYPVYSAA